MPRHVPTLYAHPEHNGDVGDDGGEGSSQGSTPSLHRQMSHNVSSISGMKSRPRQRSQMSHPPLTDGGATYQTQATPGQSTRYTDIYAQFVERYRERPNSSFFAGGAEDYAEDPRTSNALFDELSDEERPGSSYGPRMRERYSSPLMDVDTYEPVTEAERERLEWQNMLASVLDGEVLKTEKSRVHDALASFDTRSNRRFVDIWLGLRARMRGRKVDDEKKRLDERKLHLVDRFLNEIMTFRIDDDSDTTSASQQVKRILRQLDKIQSFYPTLKAFHLDKPISASEDFQSRCDTLYTWSNVLASLRSQISLLRKWTGSDSLDITHNTTSDKDAGSFLERVLKEDNIQRTFEKSALVSVHKLIGTARDTQVNLATMFEEMNLPTFEKELVQLIGFPTRMAKACLTVRLEAAQRLTAPDVLTIDQMLDDFRLTIGLACTLKRQYNEFMLPDPGGNWVLPTSIPDDYDSVLLQALNYFFKLIHWKLNAGSKDMFFRDTDVLNVFRATFNDVSISVNGGASVVAEQLCSITHKMISKANSNFEKQIRIPILAKDKARSAPFTPPHSSTATSGSGASYELHSRYANVKGRAMTGPQMIAWYEKVFESVKTRYRKLATHSRMLIQEYENAAEYSLENIQMDAFIACLVDTDHFLIYTSSYEEEGTYIVGSRGLKDSPEAIAKILQDPFHVNEIWEGGYRSAKKVSSNGSPDGEFDEEVEEDYDECAYLLILSPRVKFFWNGPVLMLQLPHISLDLEDNIIRLIGDGPRDRLVMAKAKFMESFVLVDDGEEGNEPVLPSPACVLDQMAHLPAVNRELWNIARRTDRLAEAIVEAVHHIRKSLSGVANCAELLYNWYSFATEHGQQAQKFMTRPAWMRYNQLLIRLSISWVTFICDDCDPTDRRTFKWAVSALEFALLRTKRSNILHLPEEQFDLLRQKVASCMTLLISHFDILGARSQWEAKREREKMAELRRMGSDEGPDNEDELWETQTPANEPVFQADISFDNVISAGDRSVRRFRDEVLLQLSQVEEKRMEMITEQHMIGRVLDRQKPEDQSLMELAASSSCVQIRWQQGKFVGAGAFGSVYTAVNLDTASVMAVKEIRVQDISGSPNLYKHIEDELKVMELLHHPNVVEFYGIEVHRDRVYIFEEYCEGGSLAANLEVGRIADEHILQVYTLQMLEGLIYLHSKGIVHRDIKPDNILLDHQGILKFVDFGASKVIAKATNTRMTTRSRFSATMPNTMTMNRKGGGIVADDGGLVQRNSLTGTPMYMSPESIKNDTRGRHGAMDIWSMGCVVSECATGRKPWSNLDNEWAIMFHIGVATQHPPLPDKSELSELGIDFVKQCLIIDPMRRPTAEELMEHPWIMNFMDTILSREEEELATSPPANMPSEQDYAGATVARQAAIIQEKELETIASSPPGSELTTPTSSTAGELPPVM